MIINFFSLKSFINKLFCQTKRENGFSLVELLIVIVIIGILASMAVPNFLAARRAANEGSAVASLRAIVSAEHAYAGSANSFANLNQLYTAGFIDSTFNATPATKSGYIYNIVFNPATPRAFEARVDPITHILASPLTGTGTKNFGACETGIIYQTSNNTQVTFDANRNANSPATPIGN